MLALSLLFGALIPLCPLAKSQEIGDFELPLLSRREQPSLSVADPVDCGCMLAGVGHDP